MLQLEEHPGFAGGAFQVRTSAAHDAELLRAYNLAPTAGEASASLRLLLTKRFSFGPAPRGCEVSCEINLKLKQTLAKSIAIGIESVINLLAPAEPDRFFETPSGPQNLRFSGTLPAPQLRMEDGWQRIRIALHAPAAEKFWVAPIETVSESEEGFERVYQGSQILAIWQPDLTAQKSWTARLVWRLEAF
jgi:hypothetical protein